MNVLKYLGLLIFVVMGAASLSAQESAANVAITLERTGCRGTCPAYTVTILEDGTVIYNGERSVAITGEQTSEIDPETVAAMVEALANAGYFDWDEAYTEQTVSDLPSVITSVTRDGETHRIERYMGDHSAPLALPFLEQWIDAMTYSAMWTGVQPDPAAISNGTDTPIITLQRDQCFGTCPVYSIAIYANGTVVYTGIAHVDHIGVRVFEVETPAIDSIGVRADALGYFGWNDSYEEFVITDQATVITSIRWEDQSKRIVRYDGDPSAPVGLIWVEDIIDLVVAEPTE